MEVQPLHSTPGDLLADLLCAEPPGAGAPDGMARRFSLLVERARRMPAIHKLASAVVRRAGPHGPAP